MPVVRYDDVRPTEGTKIMSEVEGKRAIVNSGIYVGLTGRIERAYSANHILLKLSGGTTIATSIRSLSVI